MASSFEEEKLLKTGEYGKRLLEAGEVLGEDKGAACLEKRKDGGRREGIRWGPRENWGG